MCKTVGEKFRTKLCPRTYNHAPLRCEGYNYLKLQWAESYLYNDLSPMFRCLDDELLSFLPTHRLDRQIYVLWHIDNFDHCSDRCDMA